MTKNKDMEKLEELIRIASQHILNKKERIEYLTHPEVKNRLYGKFPGCFIRLRKCGEEDSGEYLVPICNRAAIIDPEVIAISYKAVGKLLSNKSSSYDINELQTVLDKLDRLKQKYSKETPKPPKEAGRKALVTRMFNNIKGHLHTMNGNNKQ